MSTSHHWSQEAEEGLLSCFLQDDEATLSTALVSGVTTGSFYDPKHQIIYDCACFLKKSGLPVESATIAEELKRTKQLDMVGGYAFITQITQGQPTTARASYFTRIVVNLAARRQGLAILKQACAEFDDPSVEPDRAFDNLKQRLSATQTCSTGNGPNSYTVWSPNEFLEFKPDPSAAILGDGYVESGEWTSLVGIGGIGKTRLALWLCICQILARNFCGLATHGQPKRHLFLSTENGLRRWQSDLQKMLQPLSESERRLIDSHLRILALTRCETVDLNLSNGEAVARIGATLRSEKPEVIIFDPFADMVCGDENKTNDLVSTLRLLSSLHQANAPHAAVLLIHHARTGKANVSEAGDAFSSGNFGRGSKALYSRVRCEIQLAPGDRDDPCKLLLACGKANNCEKFTTRGLLFDKESFGYALDPDFDLDSWRAAVAGKDGGGTISPIEVAKVVGELAPCARDEARFSEILDVIRQSQDVSERTIRSRLGTAVRQGFLRSGRVKGSYRLGSNPIPN